MAFIRRTKQDVKSKTAVTLHGARTKSGRKQKSGMVVTFKDGSSTTLLTPAGKGTKYAEELRQGKHMTNDGEVKKDKKGKEKRLKDTDKAYRSGYLQAQKDAAKAHNAKENSKGGKA